MSAETPRPPRDEVIRRYQADALFHARAYRAAQAIAASRGVLLTTAGLYHGMQAVLAVEAELAAEGYSIVRDGQAVHDGQVYDLERPAHSGVGDEQGGDA